MMERKSMAWGAAVVLAASLGVAGGRALEAADKRSHFDADARELTLTEELARRDLATASGLLRRIAQEASAETFEATKVAREKAIEETVRPIQEDAALLLIQAHLLCLSQVADKSGEPAEQYLQQIIYDKLQVTKEEVATRLEKTGLGHGGLILGYVVAKLAKAPADEIFALKKDRSWAELLRSRNISPQQILSALQG